MAKIRTYIVSFSPAEKTEHGFIATISTLTTGPKHEILANCYPDLERAVRKLAADFGRSCSPYIRVPRGERNPPGFDAFCTKLQFIEAMPALIG